MTRIESRNGSDGASPSNDRHTTAIVTASPDGSYAVVAGVPLLLRAVLSAQRAGIDRVLVVDDGESERARALLESDARTRAVPIVTQGQIDENTMGYALSIPGDCLVTPRRVQALMAGSATIGGRGAGRAATGISEPDGSSGDSPSNADLIRVRTSTDVARAEAALLAELRTATVDTDGPIARLDRAVSLQLSRWLVRTPLRPNHITVLGTCVGLVAAWALAQGSYGYGLLGVCLFWGAVIIDGCDGEVARLRFLESRFGRLFDIVTDNVVHVAIFAGLTLGAHRAGRIEEVVLFATTLIAGFLCASAATYFCLLGDGPVKHRESSSRRGRIRRRLLQLFEALMNRDFAYLLIVLAVIDRLHWFLWGTVFGTYAYALGLVWVYRLGDAPAPSPEPVADSSLR